MTAHPIDTDHAVFIRECYALARSAAQKGNAPFGALLVHNGEIILAAENTTRTERDRTRHAELNLVSRAMREFDDDVLAACTLYTSTEPCVMCAGAIHEAGIRQVVYGCPADALARISSSDPGFVRQQMEMIGPVLEEEGVEIHRTCWP